MAVQWGVLGIAAAFAASIAVLRQRKTYLRRRRIEQIAAYRFPPAIFAKVAQRYPHLNESQIEKIGAGLREFFVICSLSPKAMISMPSQAVDVAWHEFILFTQDYASFCRQRLGRFLHHTPAQAMRTPTDAQEGIKRAWRIACRREGIDRHQPARLPLLFALDAELAIPDGFTYVLDCSKRPGSGYCAGDIGCSSDCGGGDGDGDGGGGDGDGGCGGD